MRRRGEQAEVVSLARHAPSNRQGSRSNHPALPGTPPYPRRGVSSWDRQALGRAFSVRGIDEILEQIRTAALE